MRFPYFLVLTTNGGSALAGMVAMSVMLPIPGYLATFLQALQAEKMKKSDARVQRVTESMLSDIRAAASIDNAVGHNSAGRHPHDQGIRLGTAYSTAASREARRGAQIREKVKVPPILYPLSEVSRIAKGDFWPR